MSGRFVGKVAVVTGAGSGVGRATAALLAAEGAAVVVADVRAEAADATADAIGRAGGRAVASVTDVSDEEAVAAMIALATGQFGRLDVLHNNAAALGPDVYGRDDGVVELDLEVWERAMAVNATGVLLGCKHAVPAMRRAGGGAIVNTSSVAAFHGGDDHAAYGVSKAAVVSLTRYVASMYGPDGIRCNAVAPGLVMSETSKAVLGARELDAFAAERALPWAAEPEDVANAVAWLASDDSRCVTGHTIVLDSGILVRRPRDVMRTWEAVLSARPPDG
jgi:NAD(P)-dependent dehydrogenase (short-subunit alcohol dehydrogenase family)